MGEEGGNLNQETIAGPTASYGSLLSSLDGAGDDVERGLKGLKPVRSRFLGQKTRRGGSFVVVRRALSHV